MSFAPFRPGESPLSDHFPTVGEADQDMALLAPITHAVRTYSTILGDYDAAALAQKHGMKLWQGIWLGADRVKNEIEITRGIALAHQYPDTITRVIVGNEVLLRRDLPPDELISAIDRVRAAIKQPVAYADVSDFWLQFPQVAPHVDIILVHLLPYWEDIPSNIDKAISRVDSVYQLMQVKFPGKQIAIGETGWPSAGRARQDAVPSRVNEARFLRQFIALSERRHFDYNFIEAADQEWKYESEGRVGANWGIFDSTRHLKIPLYGPVSDLPDWPVYAGLSIAAGFVLAIIGGFTPASVLLGMALGLALGIAAADTCPYLYDWPVRIAAAINLSGQALLAGWAMWPRALRQPLDGADTLDWLRGARRRRPGFGDLWFLFLAAAAVDQGLLAADPRYRDFPFGAYAVPLAVAAWRLGLGQGWRMPARAEAAVAAALAIGAVASLIVEGPLNTQSILWNAGALLLAASVWRVMPTPGPAKRGEAIAALR